ncbi:MAG: MarR family transcriptional regulator [Actinomycetaceae bacterium]|nr:MarR family transcriptional regulator [Actinomycetaceae bacterium]
MNSLGKRGVAWRAFFEASELLRARIDQELKMSCGIGLGEYNVLLVLHESDDHGIRMGDVARALVFAPSRLTYMVGVMEKNGWLSRVACPQDGRVAYLQKSEDGEALYAQASGVHRAVVREIFLDDLEDSDVDALVKIFTRTRNKLGASEK